MLVSEVKPIGKVGKNLLENKNAEELINILIEKPLQKACKQCKEKNIETVMSSANKNNIAKEGKIVKKKNIIEATGQFKAPTFSQAGKGYAWLMLNYNSLSDENKKILFFIEQELGQEVIWFVKSNFVDAMNTIRRRLKIKEIVEKFDDKYAKEFEKKQILLMYNNNYPNRNVFIRMPINKNTTAEAVEEYFDNIISKLVKQ